MYSCNDCGKQFEKPENNACPHCGSGDIFEEDIEEAATAEETAGEVEVETAPVEETQTIEEVIADADEKNKKGFAVALREFGEQYIQYKNSLDRAKMCIKDTIEMAKDKGITKEMLLAYASAVQLEDFNAKVLCSAVQQELGIEADGIGEKEAENNDIEAENTSDGITKEEATSEAEDNDVQQEEQSDNQDNE